MRSADCACEIPASTIARYIALSQMVRRSAGPAAFHETAKDQRSARRAREALGSKRRRSRLSLTGPWRISSPSGPDPTRSAEPQPARSPLPGAPAGNRQKVRRTNGKWLDREGFRAAAQLGLRDRISMEGRSLQHPRKRHATSRSSRLVSRMRSWRGGWVARRRKYGGCCRGSTQRSTCSGSAWY